MWSPCCWGGGQSNRETPYPLVHYPHLYNHRKEENEGIGGGGQRGGGRKRRKRQQRRAQETGEHAEKVSLLTHAS